MGVASSYRAGHDRRGDARQEAFLILHDLHVVGAWVVIGANAVVAVWALAAHWLAALRSRALWWCTAVAEVAIFVQVVLGVVLVAGEGRQAEQLHMFYGFVALATVGIIYSYRQQLHRWCFLLYGLGGLFLMGLGIRALLIKA
ncbi:MAG: hypothetical protein KY438_10890 [Actinobacteria bacterium]|nr:hypothetical protein [Actinomycetota bacterium]